MSNEKSNSMHIETEEYITGWSNDQLLNVVRVAFSWAVSAGGMSEGHAQAYQRLLKRRLGRSDYYKECMLNAVARCAEKEREQV